MANFVFSVELPLCPSVLSPRKTGGHWTVFRKASEQYKQECVLLMRQRIKQIEHDTGKHLRLPFKYGIISAVIYPTPCKGDGLYRPLDPFNLAWAMKFPVDALIEVGLLKDDKFEDCEIGYLRRVKDTTKLPHILLEVELT